MRSGLAAGVRRSRTGRLIRPPAQPARTAPWRPDPGRPSWLRSRRGRSAQAAQRRPAAPGPHTLAAQAATEIAKLSRQLRELRDATVPADVIQAARDRRWQRLQAALGAMPALHTAEVAQALGRPPGGVAKVLAKLVALVSRDLGRPPDGG